MKICLFLLSLVMLSPISLFSQSDSTATADSTQKSFGAIFLTVPFEIPIIDAGDLNSRLQDLQYPNLTVPLFNWGVGLEAQFKRYIFSFAYVSGTKTDENDSFKKEIEYRSTTVSVGYDFLESPYFSLYPYAGFKGAGVTYKYNGKARAGASFDEYFNQNLNYKEVINSHGHLDAGIGFSAQANTQITIKSGYLLFSDKLRWTMNDGDDELGNPPSIKYKFYFVISIGTGNVFTLNK